MSCGPCKASRFGCGGQGCGDAPLVRTSGFFDSLTVKAADTAGARIAKELTMFAILTSPAWLALLILPKSQR